MSGPTKSQDLNPLDFYFEEAVEAQENVKLFVCSIYVSMTYQTRVNFIFH